MKKILLLILTVLLSGVIPGVAEPAEKNLIQNGSFENVRRVLPDKWFAPGYGRDKEHIKFYVEKNGAPAGNNYLTMEVKKANEARLIQFVKVQPGSVYKFSCQIKAQGIGTKGRGANFGVLHLPDITVDVYDTGGKWRRVEFYGRTGPEQREISAVVRLGAPGAFNTGKASFDDFQLEKIQETPQGARVLNLSKKKPAPVKKKPAQKTAPIIPVTFLLCFFWVLFVGLYYYLLRLYKLPLDAGSALQKEVSAGKMGALSVTPAAMFFVFLGAALLLRIILAPVIEGYPTDINCFKGWAWIAAEKGLPGFYLSNAFVDYPPGYIYILYIIGMLGKLFSLPHNSAIFVVILKLPAIIADILTAFIIFKLGKKELGFAAASLLSLFYAFNPAVIFDSTIFGQVDSVLFLMLLLAFMFLYKNKLPAACALFVVAILIKPQALIFSPVFLFALYSRKSWKTFLYSGLAAIVTFVVVILPFSLRQDPLWIFRLYKKNLASYPFATLNAPNLFGLFGANWIKESETFFLFSYQTWGFIFIGLIVISSVFFFFKSKDKARIYFTALFIMAAVFVLTSKMHERYIFPVLTLAILSYIYGKKKGFLFLSAGFSLTFLINAAMMLHLMVNHDNHGIPGDDLLFRGISLVNICLLAYIIKIGVRRIAGAAAPAYEGPDSHVSDRVDQKGSTPASKKNPNKRSQEP